MNFNRIQTILLHTWYHFTHSMETWVDLVWNPILAMFIFGFIATSLAIAGNSEQGMHIVLGNIFWNIIWITQYGLTVGPLWEIWARSLSSMFISPLTMQEFLVGQMISGFIKSIATFIISAAIGYWLFKFSVLSLGFPLILYFLELAVFGWATGFLVLALIFRFGPTVQSLSWALVFLVQPFGGVFYSVDILPPVIRWLSYIFPTTYIYEAMRWQLKHHSLHWQLILTGTIVNVVYFILSVGVFRYIFAWSKKSGAFVRMEH